MAELCIGDVLKAVFSKYKHHLKLASLVNYIVLKRTSVMHYYEPFAQTHFPPWDKPLNDNQISSLLKTITDDIMHFFVELNKALLKKYDKDFFKGLFVAFDSTSISTYSKSLSHVEYGYNKDGDTIKQINCLIVCNQAIGIPVYIKVYKGNVIDVSTVKNLLADLNIMYTKIAKDTDMI